jgi:3-oxoacyl-[acyl-carrier-protein] synthase-3
MVEASEKVLMRNDVSINKLGCFIPHQANERIITSSAARMGIPLEKVIINIDRFGNTTAATIPLAMATAIEENRIHKGDLVLIASVGAGFTVGAALLRWEICIK